MDGDAPTLERLIKKGVDVDTRDDDDYTALIWAAEKGNEESVKVLLESGADVNAQNKYQKTALDVTASESIKKLIQEKLSKVKDEA